VKFSREGATIWAFRTSLAQPIDPFKPVESKSIRLQSEGGHPRSFISRKTRELTMYQESDAPSRLRCLILAFLPLGLVIWFDIGRTDAQEMNNLASPQPDSVVAIVGGNLIDGNGGRPLPDSCIVIRGNQMVSPGNTGSEGSESV